MQVINLETWNRKDHFNFFKNVLYPVYNICFDISIGRLKDYTRYKNLSFNLSMIYVVTEALNELENFKYRLRGSEVILHDSLTPSYTHIDKGAELFKMITIPMENDIARFVEKAKEKAGKQTEYFIPGDFIGRDDLVFYSILPWIRFTSIDHTINLQQGDAIPRVSWGKYFERDSEFYLPFNIQVNHLFVDGIHLGWLNDLIEEKIKKLY
jgi:chloramphenicol O-acetyltransferase type A